MFWLAGCWVFCPVASSRVTEWLFGEIALLYTSSQYLILTGHTNHKFSRRSTCHFVVAEVVVEEEVDVMVEEEEGEETVEEDEVVVAVVLMRDHQPKFVK